MLYYGSQQQLEYDFVVSPGKDPGVIRLAFQGADSLELDPAGNLMIKVSGGQVRQHKPVVYQQEGGSRVEVNGGYVLDAGGRVGFRVGDYDRAKPLIIDPVLSYSTFLGGVQTDKAKAIAVDSEG